jgi:hypothetical protein
VVTSREIHEVQEITIHNTGHTGFQIATQIKLNKRTLLGSGGDLRRVDGCSDSDFSYSCARLMFIPLGIVIPQLNPAPISYENTDGSITLNVARIPKQTPSGNPETESDARRLTEWQESKIASSISRFSGHRILVLCSHGNYTESYANDFVGVFHRARWKVAGPQFVKPKNEDIVDVQVTGRDTWSNEVQEPMAEAVRNALVDAGVKGKHNFTNDTDAPPGTLLLWVRHKSPDGFNPDTCLGAKWETKTERTC